MKEAIVRLEQHEARGHAVRIDGVVRWPHCVEEPDEAAFGDEADVADKDLTKLGWLRLPKRQTMTAFQELLSVDVRWGLRRHAAR